LKASQDFFNGKHFNTATGEGLGSYLDYLKTINKLKQHHKQTVYHYFTCLNAAFFQLKLLLIMP
jgi:hypothetical protein